METRALVKDDEPRAQLQLKIRTCGKEPILTPGLISIDFPRHLTILRRWLDTYTSFALNRFLEPI